MLLTHHTESSNDRGYVDHTVVIRLEEGKVANVVHLLIPYLQRDRFEIMECQGWEAIRVSLERSPF